MTPKLVHPKDDELVASVDEPESVRASVHKHVATCDHCSARLSELQQMHALLADTGSQEVAPRGDLASGALRRLRARNAAVGHMNEFVGAFVAFVRGITTLLSTEIARELHHDDEEKPNG